MKHFIKPYLALAFVLCIPTYNAQAEWFYRGTSSGWSPLQMQAESQSTFRTCQTFGSGDSSGGPRFKIDRFGDYSESYPMEDFAVQKDSAYDISINTVTHRIRINIVDQCAPEQSYKNSFASLYLRGTFNNWGLSPMTLVGDHRWRAQVFLDGRSDQRFKLDVRGDWSQNYGDSNTDSVLDPNGNDIFSSLVGDAIIEVDDKNLSYTVVGQDQPTPPQWYFRGTSNGWSKTDMIEATENIFCTQQAFVSGDNGGGPRFKVDRFGDWAESYPAQDQIMQPDSSYSICIDAQTKRISTNLLVSKDTQAPTVKSMPPAGNYSTPQEISLTIDDNRDTSPQLYYTLDGSEPTTGSPIYKDERISAVDVGNRVDLTIRALSVDASGNNQLYRFNYSIDKNLEVTTDFREETIYFVLTARFYDGDSSNNYYNRDRIKSGDPHWRGDFKGLIAQLDYIKDLGFTAVWITPPVENRSGLDYHGYHAYDWLKVDSRLESEGASYQDFIDAAHNKGLKVIQDVVINHSSQYGIRGKVWIDHLPIKYFVPAGAMQGEVDNSPYLDNLGDYKSASRDDNDNPLAPQWFKERHQSDPEGLVPLVDPKTGVSVPLAGYNPNRFFGIDANTLDGNWYHLEGFIAGGDWENPRASQTKHIAGDTIDLATGRQNVKDYLNDAIKMYLDMGVDAIRLDTAKHIERNELLSYTQEWQAHKPGLFVFGEVLVKGVGFGSELNNDNAPAAIRPWWYTRSGNNPESPQGDSKLSVLDFPLFSTFRDNVTRGSFSGIKAVLDFDWTYADSTQLVTFFQNHDVGPDNDFKYRYCCSEENAALAYNLLWTIRGIPSLYYGEEIMFMAGLPQDIQGEKDTIDQTGRAYFGPHLENIDATRSHPLYQHIKRLNNIRSRVPALQKGSMSSINEWGSGMSFVRQYNDSFVVVGLASGSSQTISVSNIPNGVYTDVITGNSVNVTGSNISFTVKDYSAGIYVLGGSSKIGNDGVYLR